MANVYQLKLRLSRNVYRFRLYVLYVETCSVAWQGDFNAKNCKKYISLEAIIDKSSYIQYLFFYLPASTCWTVPK